MVILCKKCMKKLKKILEMALEENWKFSDCAARENTSKEILQNFRSSSSKI